MDSATIDLHVSADPRWPWNGPGLSVGAYPVSLLLSGVPTNAADVSTSLSQHIAAALQVPPAQQRLQAPRFEELEEDCQMEFVKHDLMRGKWFHLDPDSLRIYRETDEFVDLSSNASVRILDQHPVRLSILPSPLPETPGGRVFVSYEGGSKQLVLPFMKPTDLIGDIKVQIQRSLGVPLSTQKLSFGWRELYGDQATAAQSGLVENSIVVLETKSAEDGDCQMKPYKIFVSLLDGSKMELQVRGCDRVGYVKERIHDLKGTPIADQQIKFREKALDENRRFKDCGVTKFETLHLMLKLRMVAGKQAAAGNVLSLVVTRDRKEVDRLQVSFKDTDTIGDVKLRLRAEHGLSWGRQQAANNSPTTRGGSSGAQEYEELQKEYQRVVEEMEKMKRELLLRANSQPEATSSGQYQDSPSLSHTSEATATVNQATPSTETLQSVDKTAFREDEVLEDRGLRKMEYPPGWTPIFAMGTEANLLSQAVAGDPAVLKVGLGSLNDTPLTPLDFSEHASSPESRASAEDDRRGVLHTAPECRQVQLVEEQEMSRPGTAPGLLSRPPVETGVSIGDSILRRYLLEARISDLD